MPIVDPSSFLSRQDRDVLFSSTADTYMFLQCDSQFEVGNLTVCLKAIRIELNMLLSDRKNPIINSCIAKKANKILNQLSPR